MNAQDLRISLEKAKDKMSIFKDEEGMLKYELKVRELLDIIVEFLTDEEKKELTNFPFFQRMTSFIQGKIIKLITDDKIKIQLLTDSKICDVFSTYDIIDIIKTLSSNGVKQLLYNQKFIEKYKFSEYQFKDIILGLDDKTKEEILLDKNLMIEQLKLSEITMEDIIKSLTTDEAKIRMLNNIELSPYSQVRIITTLSNDKKIKMLLEEKSFNKFHRIEILKSLDVEALCEFLKSNKNFCTENDISPYEIVMELDDERQKEFVQRLEDIGLDINKKREILATLSENVKRSLETTNFPQEYKSAISLKTKLRGYIEVDLNGDLDVYQGLDNLIAINPENFTDEEKTKFMKLCVICPNLGVISSLNQCVEMVSTASEYIEAEKWINEVIDSLKPEYSIAQRIAIIDNAIGKKISYSPDFGTELFDNNNSRALWKIIVSGYGVCNGISKVEQYIFERVGIESELVSGKKHTFLKLKNIEVPLANGEVVRGNTILDPTWNLSRHKFGGFPTFFCVSYDEARKQDIDFEGKDRKCHENDEKLKDATLNLDEQSLRRLFASVGLADKNGEFPLKALVEESQKRDEEYANNPYKNICEQLSLLEKVCPEFAICQMSSIDILELVLLNHKNLTFNNTIVNRVYDRRDESKTPILFVYIDSDTFGKKGFLADKNKGQFVEITEKEFQENYACYKEDLLKNSKLMPWQRQERQESLQDDDIIMTDSNPTPPEGGEER